MKPHNLAGLAVVCLLAALAGGCGDAQGQVARAALGSGDGGIIADLTSYQPAKPPTGGGGGGSSGGGRQGDAAAGGDAKAQVADLASRMQKVIEDGNVAGGLKLFVAEHVTAYDDETQSGVVTTFDSVDKLKGLVAGKFDPAKTESIMGGLRNFPSGPITVEVLDTEHATVSPNIAALLLGPAKTTPNLKAVQKDGAWHFQLDGPLTPDEAKAIVAYHTGLKAALESIMTALESGAALDETALTNLLADARQGKAVTIPAGGGAAGGDDKKPDDQPQGVTKGGRSRSPKAGPPPEDPPKEDNP